MSTSPKRSAPSPGPDDPTKRIKLDADAPAADVGAPGDVSPAAVAAVQELEPEHAPGKDKEKVPVDSGNLGNISNGMDGLEAGGSGAAQGGQSASLAPPASSSLAADPSLPSSPRCLAYSLGDWREAWVPLLLSLGFHPAVTTCIWS